MKLSKKEAENICLQYGLGRLNRFEKNDEGYLNESFIFYCTRGKFVVLVLGAYLDNWKKSKLELQFKLLNYLHKNHFPYEIPYPIKNKNGDYLYETHGKYLWVYKFIEGEIKKNFSKEDFIEMIKAIAYFHKYTKKFNEKDAGRYDDFSWLEQEYLKLNNLKVKNKLDGLMKKNIDLMLFLINKMKKINFGKFIVTHSDFNEGNVIFRN